MGQEQSSTMNGAEAQGAPRSCRPCGDWGQKDHGTVKVDAAALHALGKENAAPPNIVKVAGGMSKEEEEKARQRREWEAKQEELRRQEEERKEMERRIKEEQERQQAELRRREAERRRLQLEQEAKEREEQERQRREREEQLALQRKRQEQERQLEEQRKEEARRQKMQEIEEQKKIRSWLEANGFKGVNDLVRKKFSKVAPLYCAVQQNDVAMLQLLLKNGADASKVNGKNESALTVAQKMDKKGSHAAMIQILTTYAK